MRTESGVRREQPVGDLGDFLLALHDLAHHGRRVIPARQTSGEPGDFGFKFRLAALHPVHFAADVFEFFDKLRFEAFQNVGDDILAQHFLLQAREQFPLEHVPADAKTIRTDRVASMEVHRAAVSLVCVIAAASGHDLQIGAARRCISAGPRTSMAHSSPRI